MSAEQKITIFIYNQFGRVVPSLTKSFPATEKRAAMAYKRRMQDMADPMPASFNKRA